MVEGFRSKWAMKLSSCALSCVLLSPGVWANGKLKVPDKELKESRAQRESPSGDRSLRPFTAAEIQLLESGESVKRKFRIPRPDAIYHAGYSYRLVEATPMDIIRALRAPDGIVEVIPYGRSATTLSESDGMSRMRIRQGKAPVIGEYTVLVQWDLNDYQARFWMDPTEPHDVDDVWGIFSAREVRPGVTLISFGFAFNIGGVGTLLENKAQEWGLTTANRIAKHVKGA